AMFPLFASPPPAIVWDTPSTDARGSMPLGNGDIALNAWVEPSGDLLFYIGKSDSWEDNSRLAKVGLVRLALRPALLPPGTVFRQELVTADGTLVISATLPPVAPGAKSAPSTTLRLWVDANHPVIHVTAESPVPVTATASFEPWRNAPSTLPGIEISDINFDWSKPDKQARPTVVEPDTVLAGLPDGVGWYHHNARSHGPVETMAHQDLLGWPAWRDPILHRTFGAIIRSSAGVRLDDRRLENPAAKKHRFDVHVLTLHPSSPDQWLSALRDQIKRVDRASFASRRRAHVTWWKQFWARSHIVATPASAETDPAAPTDVSHGYALQRYVTACAGRGAYPIKFNGSLFTVPWPGKPGDADFRRWGPGYWWQNTRLPYVSLCGSGDFDLLAPLHNLYAGPLRDLSVYRAKHYFGFADSLYFPECMYLWGACFPESYGPRPAAERTDKLQDSGWHKWEWVGALEFAHLLQDYYAHTGDERFLREKLLPTALPALRFFERFYQTGPDGKLVLHPAQALETWWDATNPTPEVAGLRAVSARLLALPPRLLPAADRLWLENFAARLPALPTLEQDGVRQLAPAEKFANCRNSEVPELYAVYPFRLVSFEKENAPLGLAALDRRAHRGPIAWRQDELFMAYLGRADDAADYLVKRVRNRGENLIGDERHEMRFPSFWGPGYDWIPDQCHGGMIMAASQAMLLQTEGDKIFLLPAWPSRWNVDFKLHAPSRTVVEASVRDGKLVSLRVTPSARRADVIVPAAFR
ncbi:MAG: hypothetical protein RLZZ50_1383, partial [Verrucomicrobiota bacterium]